MKIVSELTLQYPLFHLTNEIKSWNFYYRDIFAQYCGEQVTHNMKCAAGQFCHPSRKLDPSTHGGSNTVYHF